MRWLAAGVVLAAIAAAVWWLSRTDAPPPRAHAIRSGTITLDVGAFKRLRDARIERAKRIANAPRQQGAGSGLAGVPLSWHFADKQCDLGPAELCDLLGDLFDDCDAGESAACFALGQFVADTPPRTLIATVFFVKACDLGEREACAYMQKVQGTPPQQRCADDPFICGWRAMRSNDRSLNEEACLAGVGDACSAVSYFFGDKLDDAVTSQVYLEKACQLGVPQSCHVLANRLSRDCDPQEISDDLVTPCYAIDEALAEQARTIGCEAGWGVGCRYN